MSVEEFLALNDDEGGFAEYVNGEVIRWNPTRQRQKLLLFLARLLSNFVEEKDAGEVIIAAYKVHIKTDTVREPDILFVANEIRDRLTKQHLDGAAYPCGWIHQPGKPHTRSPRQIERICGCRSV